MFRLNGCMDGQITWGDYTFQLFTANEQDTNMKEIA